MPININLLREEKGGNVALVKESQKKRFASVELVDEVIKLDTEWRQAQFKQDKRNQALTQKSKQFGQLKKNNEDTTALQEEIKTLKAEIAQGEKDVAALAEQRDAKLSMIGNIVHESVVVSDDEANNKIERTWGECKQTGKELHHHQLLHMIDGANTESAVKIAGHRAYFLKGVGVLLNQALINYGLAFLMKRGYIPLQPPLFMNREVMAETAQLEQFDKELYKVTVESDTKEVEDKYLIATSEQPISAYHRKEVLNEAELPLKYAGISSCFRKEAGSSGRDAWGIFRVHQFEKVEQFVVCSPEKSWEMHEEMIKISEEFFKSLGFSYRVVNIVSKELNNAAAKKYDLEAWFPTLGVYRELVSCSNCTDYQSRAMDTKYGQKKQGARDVPYVHMLNSTLTATERTICCILENYQTEEGVIVPEVLRPYMGGLEIMKFVKPVPRNLQKERQERAAEKKKGGKDGDEAEKPADQ